MTQAGADAMLPALYAAADAVVVCESRGFERSAWVRTHMALAFAFSPSGSHIYLVDRQLIHVPRHIRHPVEPDCPPLMATSNCSACRASSRFALAPRMGAFGPCHMHAHLRFSATSSAAARAHTRQILKLVFKNDFFREIQYPQTTLEHCHEYGAL